MALGIRRGTLLAIVMLAISGSSKPGFSQEKTDAQAPFVAEIAFQYAAVNRSGAAKVLDQALSLTEGMQNDCYKAAPLMRVANGYILAGQSEKGQQLLTRAFQIAHAQTIANCALSATSPEESLLNRAVDYAEAGYYDFALQITQRGDNWFTPIAMVRIAKSYKNDQKPDRAKQIIDKALTVAQRNPDLRSRRQTLMAIAFALQSTGQSEFLSSATKQVLDSIRTNPKTQSEDTAWNVTQTLQITDLLIVNGQKPQAIALLNQVLPEIRALRSTQFPAEKVYLLSQAAIQYAAVGQASQAKAILATAQSTAQALKPSPFLNNAFAQVAIGYVKNGQLQTARELANRIKTRVDREQVFQAIAMHYVESGDVDQAVKLARSLSTAKNLTLTEIVRYYLANKQYDQALKIAQREDVQGVLPDVALAYAEAGKPEQALRVAKSVKPLSNNPAYLDWLMPAFARSFAQQGQFEQALQVAQATQNKQYKSQALTAIAAQYIAKDRVANRSKATEILDQALKVALSIK